MDLIAGTRLDRYIVRSKLGSGGMGDVYLADDTQLGRRVALKLLPSSADTDAHARSRLVREARAAATLDHPYICSVYEVGEADGRLFIAMQYVDGEPLDARLRKGALMLEETLSIAVQVADALSTAHQGGILHRDIKPANIMLTSRGEAKVMDFGLAKLTGSALGETDTVSVLSAPGAVLGTVPYMSPEQVRGEALDPRSDVFSVGVVLYEMLAGRRPFDDSSPAATASAILTREPPAIARFAPNTPAELERIVTKMLRKDADGRYQSSKDLLIDLRTLKEEQDFNARLVRSDSRGSGATVVTAAKARSPRTRLVLVTAGLLAVLGAGGWWMWRSSKARWAEAQVPRIVALADERRYFEAYDLATAVERYLPDEKRLAAVMPIISDTLSATSDPAGARVFLARFSQAASDLPVARELVGTTPISNLRIARGEYIVSLEKEGYAASERSVSGLTTRVGGLTIMPPPASINQRLVRADAIPPRMTLVPGGDYRLVAWSRPTDKRVTLNDYFIDKFEVTNDEYKEFISAGGYVKRDFWRFPIVKDGRTVPWEEAMKMFVDRTGLPGPRSWSGQTVPAGRGDHPVTEVSWYEAAAYAEFRGKRLPTVFEWEKAARNGVRGTAGVTFMPWGVFYPGDTLVHRANFAASGTLPATSGAFGMSAFGVYNMAGNVAEWTLNDGSDGFIATGGAWADAIYAFGQYGGRPGVFNSNNLGFRLVQQPPGARGDQGAGRIESAQEIPNYTVSSAGAFAEWASAYGYPKAPLDARVEETKEFADWTREKITYNGAGDARAIAYLYLPRHVTRPLQVIHYVPAGDVDGGFRSLTDSIDDRLTPFVRAGRVAFGVVLKGYIERLKPDRVPVDHRTVEYAEMIYDRVTDLRRGLDYLETRPDIDSKRVAFFGPSAGAQIGLILAAVETRYRGVVLVGAGLARRFEPPAVANPANFAPHILAPKLLIQGLYDEDTPLKTASQPLFKLMVQPKQLFLYEGGHVPSVEITMSAASGWLDQTLGPVKR